MDSTFLLLLLTFWPGWVQVDPTGACRQVGEGCWARLAPCHCPGLLHHLQCDDCHCCCCGRRLSCMWWDLNTTITIFSMILSREGWSLSAPSTGTSMLGRRKGSRRLTLSKLTGKLTLMLLLVLLFLLFLFLLLLLLLFQHLIPQDTVHADVCRHGCQGSSPGWAALTGLWQFNWPLTATIMSVMIKYTGDLPFVWLVISLSSSVQGSVARTISSQKMDGFYGL